MHISTEAYAHIKRQKGICTPRQAPWPPRIKSLNGNREKGNCVPRSQYLLRTGRCPLRIATLCKGVSGQFPSSPSISVTRRPMSEMVSPVDVTNPSLQEAQPPCYTFRESIKGERSFSMGEKKVRICNVRTSLSFCSTSFEHACNGIQASLSPTPTPAKFCLRQTESRRKK